MSQAILDALKALDVSNDNHWTADGLPRLDTIKMLASDQSLTRDKVDAAAPGFTRAAAPTYEVPAGTDEGQAPQEGENTPAGAEQPEAQGTEPDAPEHTPTESESPAGAEAVPGSNDEGEGDSGASFSESETEQAEVAVIGSDVSDEVASLEAAVAEAKAEEEELLQAMGKLEAKLSEVRQVKDDAVAQLEKVKSARTQTNDIQDYLASQKRALAERAAKSNLLRESGIDLKELSRNLKAPIDASMARKNSRGAARPKGM